MDVIWRQSTMCMYDLRKGDLFVLELGKGGTSEAGKYLFRAVMCGEGVRRIWLLSIVTRYLEAIDVCIWCMLFYVCCSDCVGFCGKVCCVAAVVEDSIFLALEC